MKTGNTGSALRTGQSKTKDMTQGPIVKELILFSLPLLLGNIFQQFYSTVDSIVVGNFVSAEALAAVTMTSVAVNTLVGLFVGMSTGASVVISQRFGAKDDAGLRKAVHTSLLATFILGLFMMAVGYAATPALLRIMQTPEDVFPLAQTYLRIYFLGIEGLMFYNMTSAVLRAVGDSRRPLYFLIVTSLLNVVLDLVFVLVFRQGVAGVACATVIAQFVSAALGMAVLMRSRENYGVRLRELKIDPASLYKIIYIGLPAGLQMAIISFSNVFVQGYINAFGSESAAGWGAYGRVDAFVMLPLQSIALAVTTFTGQNAGAGNVERIRQGVRKSILLGITLTCAICIAEFIAAPTIVSWFNSKPEVIHYGSLFIRLNCLFDGLCTSNQIHASALRGVGDAKAPMYIMIFSFVIFRQIYLFVCSHVTDSIVPISLGYPMGWIVCTLIMGVYYRRSHWERRIGKGIMAS
ncbi:MAG: MATE family efflux transporter [Lachnospiraceae bacterium]|nr:MATE family efflux transporter [Lachnospiraceae bacterium]